MDNMVVIAHNAHEMATAQQELSSWAAAKVAEAREHENEVAEGLRMAEQHKWGTAALRRSLTQAKKHREFYHKLDAAIRLGYVIVPNFPMDVFAIRTARDLPLRGTNYSWSTHEQRSESPAIGEGEYVSSLPEVHQTATREVENGREITRRMSWAKAFRDVAFPVAIVKPQIMDDTGRAMAAKVFDEIGIAPQGMMRKRKFDPMIVGTIVHRAGYHEHRVSFLISWWLTSRDLSIR